MAKAHEIAVAAETGAFEKGIKSGVIEPIEKAEDALEKLGKAKGADGLDRSMESAQKSTKDLRKEIDQTSDAIDKGFSQSYGKLKTSAQDATHVASEASGELKQNLGETFSSFRGDLEDLPQIAQDVFGGMAGSVGGLLPALGLAAGAAGIGLLINAFNNAGEESEEFKAKAAELAEAYIAASGKAAPAVEDIADALRELATTTDEGVTSLADLREMTDKAGVDFKDIAEIYAGNTEGLDELIETHKKHLDALTDEANSLDLSTEAGQRRQQQIGEEREGLEGIIPVLEESSRLSQEAAEREAAWVAAGGPEYEAKANYIATLNDAYDEAAGSIDDFINKETGIFDVQGYLNAMQQRSEALANYRNNVAASGLSPEALNFLNSQGYEAASVMLQGYMSATPELQAQLRAVWEQAGADASGSASNSINAGLNQPFTATINADTNMVTDAMSGILAVGQALAPTVKVNADTAKADAQLKETAKKRDTEIAVRTTGVDEANAAINSAAAERVAKIRYVVDDAAVRNYVPPVKTQVVKMRPQFTE